MPNPVIKVENLSKQYRLGLVGSDTLSDDLKRWWYRLRGKEDPFLMIGESNDRASKGQSEYVWALKDINFEVQQGEVLGIIGKNGAGKSTLLKILSKVTGPTTGSIKAKGRVASLLEVGTGFHPELTGRENIYLNGTILGMTKKEVDQKIDEIIDFAGVERYVDTPVKRYSSGMRVRLGFAVAAHLDPEILIVDEVLAVGDAEFQKKAVGKMKEVSGQGGRTVLFVSHNMTSINSLCTRCILLEDGQLTMDGVTSEVVNKYLGRGKSLQHLYEFGEEGVVQCGALVLKSIGIKPKGGDFDSVLTMEDPLEVHIAFEKKEMGTDRMDMTLQFMNNEGDVIFPTGSGLIFDDEAYKNLPAGPHRFCCEIPAPFFNEGDFGLNLLLVKNRRKVLRKWDTVLSFQISPDKKGFGVWMGKSKGFLKPDFQWNYV
jgi:lipopolysaccharide transport system ATP-binding protein